MKSIRKKAAVICGLLMIIVLISSCSQTTEQAPAASTEPGTSATADPNAFVYEEGISWNSSYTDITKRYGEPASTEYRKTSLIATYENPVIDGHTLKYRIFHFSTETGRIKKIMEESDERKANLTADDLTTDQNIYQALTEKFGEPDVTGEGVFPQWTRVYPDTKISFASIRDIDRTIITFQNLTDDAGQQPYTDLPTQPPEGE